MDCWWTTGPNVTVLSPDLPQPVLLCQPTWMKMSMKMRTMDPPRHGKERKHKTNTPLLALNPYTPPPHTSGGGQDPMCSPTPGSPLPGLGLHSSVSSNQ